MPTISGTTDMQGIIEVWGLFDQYTYTEVKERPIYSFGYGSSVQILKGGPVSYIGIRDIRASLNVMSRESYDLLSAIRAELQGIKNLKAAIRAAFAEIEKDLPALIRPTIDDLRDLSGAIGGHAPEDIEASIGGHLPINLVIAIKSWYRENVKNLPAEIIGEWFKGSLNLGSIIDMHPPVNLKALLQGFDTLDLQVEISSVYKFDLEAIIQSTTLANLLAQIMVIDPVNLQGLLHGWDERFLPADIDGVYGPYDIQAYLRVHPYLDLPSTIRGWYSGIGNLQAFVGGYYTRDLSAFISAIEAVNLGAEILAEVKIKDLQAFIVPNIIRIKQVVNVALLAHKNLGALINFQCFGSGSANLMAKLTASYKLDLRSIIWGWLQDADPIPLRSYINTSIYDVENKIDLDFVPYNPYTQLKVKFNAVGQYKVFDTLSVWYGNFYAYMLNATITAVPRSRNLSASIRPVLQANYTELPSSVMPKSNVIVYKFTDKMEEEWRKFVQLMFKKDGAEPYHYFYVYGTDQVYKVDRNRHWTIWATSYDKDTGGVYDRTNVRTKFIFRMDRYESVDEAVRDLIDRVSAYRESLLAAYINAVDDRPQLNLPTSIFGFGGPKRRWAKYLNASITVQVPEYEPPDGDDADILLSGEYTAPAGDVADLHIVYHGHPEE